MTMDFGIGVFRRHRHPDGTDWPVSGPCEYWFNLHADGWAEAVADAAHLCGEEILPAEVVWKWVDSKDYGEQYELYYTCGEFMSLRYLFRVVNFTGLTKKGKHADHQVPL